jgi:hypothetical protein
MYQYVPITCNQHVPTYTKYTNNMYQYSPQYIISDNIDLILNITRISIKQSCTSKTSTTYTITSASTMHITTPHNHHQYQDLYATSTINHVPISLQICPTILPTSASNNVPSMYKSCINNKPSYTSSRCTNITIPYTSCICQLIN